MILNLAILRFGKAFAEISHTKHQEQFLALVDDRNKG